MKNSLSYLKLWQQKRDELPVNESAQTDWQQMHSLLNTHLPVVPNGAAANATKASKISKIIKAVKGFKALVVLLSSAVTITTGVFVYQHIQKINSNQTGKAHKKTSLIVPADSLAMEDSLNKANELTNKTDSLADVQTASDNTSSTKQNPADSLLNDGSTSPGKKLGADVNTNKSAVGRRPGSATSILNNKGNGLGQHSGKIGGGTYQSSKNGKGSFIADNNTRQKDHDIAVSAANQHLGVQGGSYQPLLLSRHQSESFSLISGVDAIQTDLNKYFVQSTINDILYTDAKQRNALIRKNRAIIVRAIAGKTSKPSAGSSKTNQKDKKEKPAKAKTSSPLDIDWGLLMGANSSGSFTAKSQNSNFYGSLPVDIHFGLYGTYHFNDKWALNVQVKALSGQNFGGSYTHANGAKADSGAVDSGKTIRVTDSRKAYFVSVPIHLVYKLNNYVSIKAGPVINIPVKQSAGSTSFTPLAIKTDTPYYTSVNNQLKNTKYVPAINLGVSAGVSLQYNRLSFEATYLKSISGFRVSSDFGSYKSNPGTVQLTIGFQLNKPKNK
jgi:hypothetical protein